MKEIYLHYLWKYKIPPLHQLKLSNGDSFKIIQYGEYNAYESGPDFLNAKVEINGVLWVGHVEIHVRSLDWYSHKHQNDRAYDTVILHVVYEHNGEVIQNNNQLPTLELKSVVSLNNYDKYLTLFKDKNTILCGSQLAKISSFYITSQQEIALFNRLNRKTANLIEITSTTEPKQILYFLIARAMGAKINQLPFEELAQRLPISIIKKIDKKDQRNIIQMTSGVFHPETTAELIRYPHLLKIHENISKGIVNKSSWKYGGARPGNAPNIRIQQFALIVEKFDFEISFFYLNIKDLYDYCLELLTIVEGENINNTLIKKLTISFKHQIIINCFVPFLFWLGQTRSDAVLVDKAFDMLRIMPPEKNSITEKWKKFGYLTNNAAESQAMLEIFNEFCTHKKCLSCNIGKQLLSK